MDNFFIQKVDVSMKIQSGWILSFLMISRIVQNY